MTELRGVNVDIQFSQLRAYLPSWSICSPLVADGQQRQEKCEFGAATVKLVQPSAYRVGPLLINCSLFDLGIFPFSYNLQTRNARLDNLYHLVCNFVPVSCELTPWTRFTVRAHGKSMASWHCTVEFHSPCASSFGFTDRGPNVVNGYKLFIKSLENPSCTMKQHSPFAYLMHVSQGSRIYIYFKTLFLSVQFCIDHRRFTAGIKLFHIGNVHTHLLPRLVATRPTSSSLHTLWKVLPVSPGFSLVANL